MRHKLTILICIIVIAIVGVGTDRAHHSYEVHQQQIANIAAQAQQEAATKQAQFQAGVQMDEAQCEKDKVAYNALTVPVKLKTVAPDCEVNLIQ